MSRRARIAPFDLSRPSRAASVGNPEDSPPSLRTSKAASVQHNRPSGVVVRLKVGSHTVEPAKPVASCNLFAKDRARLALADEPEHLRPEVPMVGFTLPLPGGAEWLAGAGAGPNRPAWIPYGKLQGKRPSADSGEQVNLGVSSEFIGFQFLDRGFAHVAGWQVTLFDEFPQPCRGVTVDVVVKVQALSPFNFASNSPTLLTSRYTPPAASISA